MDDSHGNTPSFPEINIKNLAQSAKENHIRLAANLAHDLKRHDKKLVESYLDGDQSEVLKHLGLFTTKRHELKKKLINLPSISVPGDPIAREIISKVNNDFRFRADIIVDYLIMTLTPESHKKKKEFVKEKDEWELYILSLLGEIVKSNEAKLQASENSSSLKEIEPEDTESEEIKNDWNTLQKLCIPLLQRPPEHFVEHLYEIGSLVLGISIPEKLDKYVREARISYASKNYLAVYAMCRTILETSIRDIGQRKQRLPKDDGKVKRWELRNFNHMKNKVVPKALREDVAIVYDITSGLIHGSASVKREGARQMFKRTLTIIQELYDHYHLS